MASRRTGMNRNALLTLLLLFPLALSSCILLGFERRPSYAKLGSQLRCEKRYDEAVERYREHIEARLEDSRREPDENPYFYLIIIGDIYLEQGNTEKAMESFIEAKQKEVELALVADRVRRAAQVLRSQKKLREAVSLLKEFRELDDFGFDLDLDELLKEIVALEDKKGGL